MDSVTLPADVPEGYMRNCYGHLVPEHSIRPQVLMMDQLVKQLIAAARELQNSMVVFKARSFADTEAFMQLLSEKYDAKPRSAGNTSFETFDGLMRVEISTGHFLALGPELAAAKSLIDECLTSWSDGANANLRAIVNDAFAVGEGGKLQVDRVLALRRVQIDDPRWRRAMEAISDAVKITRSKRYMRFHTRPTTDDKWTQITLDLARV